MQSAEELLKEIEKIIDALIENAQQLIEISQQVIAQEELETLQKHQEKLLNELTAKDDAYHELFKGTKSNSHSANHKRIDAKLEKFQQLNAAFIENITATRGLIHFEKGKTKKLKKSS